MKMQKVEIEVPVFEGYEFYKYGLIDESTPDDIHICRHQMSGVQLVDKLRVVICKDTRYLIYKKKPSRRIIFEEIGVGYVKPGDLFIDDHGMLQIWDGKCCSFTNAPKLRKVHDDFEVKNG